MGKKLKPGDFTVAEGHGHPLVYIWGPLLYANVVNMKEQQPKKC
jgi:hypothetical protein